MATQSKGLDRREVKNWFSTLSFEVQEAILGDFKDAFTASKAERINELEGELAKLRNGAASHAPRARRGRPPRAATAKKASAKKGVKVAPKYADKSGNTWAGRGVYPVWIRDYLKKRGNKLDDLLIAKKG